MTNMTLGQFLEACSENNSILIFYYVALPLTAFLASIFGKNEGNKAPWNYLYTTLVFLACIPGIFAFTLNFYLLFFENKSFLEANIYTQILPILVMFLTLFLIKRNVSFHDIPGFDKLSNLVFLLTIIIALFWVLEKTHIVVFTYIPFTIFVLVFVLILVAFRMFLKRMFK